MLALETVAVGEHGRAPQYGATFGPRAIALVMQAPVGAPQVAIPGTLEILGPPATLMR